MPVLYIISMMSHCFLPLLYHCFLPYTKRKRYHVPERNFSKYFPWASHFKDLLDDALSHMV